MNWRDLECQTINLCICNYLYRHIFIINNYCLFVKCRNNRICVSPVIACSRSTALRDLTIGELLHGCAYLATPGGSGTCVHSCGYLTTPGGSGICAHSCGYLTLPSWPVYTAVLTRHPPHPQGAVRSSVLRWLSYPGWIIVLGVDVLQACKNYIFEILPTCVLKKFFFTKKKNIFFLLRPHSPAASSVMARWLPVDLRAFHRVTTFEGTGEPQLCSLVLVFQKSPCKASVMRVHSLRLLFRKAGDTLPGFDE